MREILFRGKGSHDGKWVYGFLINFKNSETEICYEYDESWGDNNCKCVTPETVGQFTGITDKNGEKIFEGDIVRIDGAEEVYVIEYNDEEAAFEVTGQISCVCVDFISHLFGSDVEVIGNIYDNSELLETEDENAR